MLKNVLISGSLALLVLTGCSTKSKDVTIVNEKGKYGTLETDSKVVIKPVYDELSNFEDVENKNVINEHPHYINLHWIHDRDGEEYAIAEYQGKYGIVSRENKMLVKPIYDSISKRFNGFFVIELDDKFGYMDKNFEVVQKPIFKFAREFVGNVTFVQSNANAKWGCITKEMDLKINDEYNEIYSLRNGYARTVKDGKWGFLNDKCEVVVEPKYEYAYDYSKGFAKVVKDNQVAYINAEGKEITKAIFTSGENF